MSELQDDSRLPLYTEGLGLTPAAHPRRAIGAYICISAANGDIFSVQNADAELDQSRLVSAVGLRSKKHLDATIKSLVRFVSTFTIYHQRY